MKKNDKKLKIDLSDIYESEDLFLKECIEVEKNINKIKKFQNHVLDSSDKLLEALNLDKEISVILEKLYIYAHINNDIDLSIPKWNENLGKVLLLFNKYSENAAYFIPELLEKDYKLIKEYITSNKELKEYELNLKEIFRTKKHILSKIEEQILATLGDAFRVPGDAISKLTDVDVTYGDITLEDGSTVTITNSNFIIYLESKNRDIRKQTFNAIYNGLKGISHTSSVLLAGEVRNANVRAKLRKYSSALDASLDSNNINTNIYDVLIKSVRKKLPLLQKQWDVRKNILGLEKLEIYDTYVPLIEKFDKEYSFDEARDMIQTSLLGLGTEYSHVINDFFSKGWMDVNPGDNKRTGAYCTCAYAAHPYVFLNYKGKYNDVSTITHELGHALHYHFAKENNTFTNYNYSIFVAEVASQVNEILLFKHLFDKSNDLDEKLFLLDNSLKGFKATIVRQTMFAEYEKAIHELDQKGTILTDEVLNEVYLKLNKDYYGKNVFVDDLIKYEWIRISHFFYNFYVYQYSTGYIAALIIAEDIWNKKEGALDKYLEFLKLGSTKDPVESLKVAGVDITSAKVYNNAFKVFEKTLDEFEKLYNSKEEK